jgi:SH3-like domain-containing protein
MGLFGRHKGATDRQEGKIMITKGSFQRFSFLIVLTILFFPITAISAPAEHTQGQTAASEKPSEATKVGEYASIDQNVSGANIRYAATLSAEVLRSVPPGYPVFILERLGDWALVEDFKERRGWVFASLLTEPKTVIIKVLRGNLRRGPSLTDLIINKLDQGTVLFIIKKRGDWLQVSESDGFTGWLHRDVVWPGDARSASKQEAVSAEAALRSEEVPTRAVEKIPSRKIEEKKSAFAEQIQPVAGKEILAAPIKENKAEAVNNLQPAYISNIYLANNLVMKNNIQHPDIVVNVLKANDPQAITYLVIDLVGDMGVHNLELEIFDMNGRQVSPIQKIKPWAAEKNNAYIKVTAKLSGSFPEGGIFFKLSDTLDSGSKTSLGLFKVITVK